MGESYLPCCYCCLSEEEKNAIYLNSDIKRSLAEQKKRQRRETKVLLLGTGESGKTTFMKQMKIIHGKGFSEDERGGYTKLVFQNIFTAMKAMTQAMSALKIPYANPQNETNSKLFQCLEDYDIHQITQIRREHVDAIHRLWADQGIQFCYQQRREYQLLDSTSYYIKNLNRIAAEGYIPTDQDVLQVRFPTLGITDHCFSLKNIILRIVDVGGQRGERRKWIHCFENVTSVIFLASLSEYDQRLEENDKINRMQESLSLFYTVIHSNWFRNSTVILFLNKQDILAEKIQISDLKVYYPEFTGKRRDANMAMKFIGELYLHEAVCRETGNIKKVYHHFTCATDTNNIRTVFDDVKDTVLMKSIKEFIFN